MGTQLNQGIQTSLFEFFAESPQFTTHEAYDACNEAGLHVNKESIRARIYEAINMGVFEKVSKGVYKVVKKVDNDETVCLLINGNGRDLSMIKDNSIDGIITDHPYEIAKQLQGGNRSFATYDSFRYTKQDFEEKYRKLKDGSFLVEFLPVESEANWEYLYAIKKFAVEAGFKYYSKVPWIKGTFVSNCGRSAKNSEEILILSKGEPRSLRLDTKKNLAEASSHGLDTHGLDSYALRDLLIKNDLTVHFMKGTASILPVSFVAQPKPSNKKVMEAEKPVELLEEIIEYISLPDELLLDQFSGSHNLVLAALNKKRRVITYESDPCIYEKAINYLNDNIRPDVKMEGGKQ